MNDADLYHLQAKPGLVFLREKGRAPGAASRRLERLVAPHLTGEMEYTLPISEVLELMQEMAGQKALFFQGSPVLADFFSRVQLEVFIEEEEQSYTAYGIVSSKRQSFFIDEVDFLGPGWFIKDQLLRIFHEDIATSLIRGLNTPLPLEEMKVFARLHDLEFSVQEPCVQLRLRLQDPFGLTASFDGERDEELLLAGYERRKRGYYCPQDKVRSAISALLESGWEVISSLGCQVEQAVPPRIHWVSKGNEFVLESSTETTTLFQAAKSPTGLVGAKLFSASRELTQLSHILDELVSQGGRLRLQKEHIGLLGQSVKNCLENARELRLHEDFKGELRSYQESGSRWLLELYQKGFHGLLADEMGLGKTVQAISFLARSHALPALIVVPKSLLFQWKAEVERFFPSVSLYLHHGEQREGVGDIVLTSYQTLVRDIELFSHKAFSTVILDESQTIKNPASQVAKAAFQLQGDFRLAMTGTPVENSLEDLHSQFHFLIPGLTKKEQDPGVTKRLCRPYILRRTKDEVLPELPEKIQQNINIEMGSGERAIYDEFLAAVRSRLLHKVKLDGVAASRVEIFEVLLRLRQICCHSALVQSLLAGKPVPSQKLETLKMDLETLFQEGKSVIVFSQFVEMLKIIEGQIPWPCLLLHGQMEASLRETAVQRFQSGDCPILLASLRAAGVGLNLTRADAVYLYDPWWNGAVEEQAIARAHRMGRSGAVVVKRLLMKDSIEEHVQRLRKAKLELSSELFSESADWSISDLEDLLH